jgi:hypothetical protein
MTTLGLLRDVAHHHGGARADGQHLLRRPASLLARDNYLPHLYALRDDRQVFASGIWTLAMLSGALLVAMGGNTLTLIPLYAIGVFTGSCTTTSTWSSPGHCGTGRTSSSPACRCECTSTAARRAATSPGDARDHEMAKRCGKPVELNRRRRICVPF